MSKPTLTKQVNTVKLNHYANKAPHGQDIFQSIFQTSSNCLHLLCLLMLLNMKRKWMKTIRKYDSTFYVSVGQVKNGRLYGTGAVHALFKIWEDGICVVVTQLAGNCQR